MSNLYMFDCFNVIFQEIAPRFFEAFFSKEEAKELKEKYFHDIDLGKVTLDEFYLKIEKDYGIPVSKAKRFWDEPPQLNEAILPYLKELTKKGDVVLVSNAPKGLVESLFEKRGLTSLFKKIYSSSALGLAKPDPRIYEYVIRDQHKSYENVYMIDDNPKNLEPLPSLHVKGVLFVSNSSLKSLLK